MNATELADALDNDYADIFRKDAAIMLRQQQEEIENLKRINKHEHIVVENALNEVESLKDKLMLKTKVLEMVQGWVNDR